MVLPIINPTKSFWIEAAGSSLKDFRSTAVLPSETDVTIIGSGYAGAATAYWLHKHTEQSVYKPKILLLEARDICGSSTGRNGGQLRPHAYSRYPAWSSRFGPDGGMELIRHEMAHLPAFERLLADEGIAEEACLKFGETFDAAMSEEAWGRLRGAYEAMKRDHGDSNDVVSQCRLIEDPEEAVEFTQMKGCIGAVVHPAGQVWPYKFIHALLRIALASGSLNLQAHTPVESVCERDGIKIVKTARGDVRTKVVVHATNRWASHLVPEFENLILPDRATLAAIKAPEGFIKHTGAQHWDSNVNNYHLQLPPPFNTIILGGARPRLAHIPQECLPSDAEDKQFDGVPQYFKSWPKRNVMNWPGATELARGVDDGGCWTGVDSDSIDSFPFVGEIPNRREQFIVAGFSGHGMPRILLSAAHLVPLILDVLAIDYKAPSLVAPYPALPKPFRLTADRLETLRGADVAAKYEAFAKGYRESAAKPFCQEWS